MLTRDSRPVTYVLVDNRSIRSGSPEDRPIAMRSGSKDAPIQLMHEAEFYTRDGLYLGRIGYWPDDPIDMPAERPGETGKGVTVWVEFNPAAVIVEPVARTTDWSGNGQDSLG